MFLQARGVPDGTRLEADVCIIGAGAAGITLARELSGRPLRVVLLESGGFRMERATQALYRGEIVGMPYDLETTRSRFFGGSTNCWAGFNRPLDERHFAPRPWIPHSGWPISRADLDPYYLRAHAVCAIGRTATTPRRRSRR